MKDTEGKIHNERHRGKTQNERHGRKATVGKTQKERQNERYRMKDTE